MYLPHVHGKSAWTLVPYTYTHFLPLFMGRQLYFSIHFVENRISLQHFHFLIKTILIFSPANSWCKFCCWFIGFETQKEIQCCPYTQSQSVRGSENLCHQKHCLWRTSEGHPQTPSGSCKSQFISYSSMQC